MYIHILEYGEPSENIAQAFLLLQALAYGIDGWKCDGTDPYILELIIPLGKGGVVTRKHYSDAYYGDFFDYTRKTRGNETLIMSRPVDGLESIHRNTHLLFTHLIFLL